MSTTEKDQRPQSEQRQSRDGAPRLVWAAKPATVERVTLPFQVVETINESRATREAERGTLFRTSSPRDATGWHNKLIWGENKLVLGSLLQDYAGEIDLVYIDPPFATGSDFEVEVKIGTESISKSPSILEEHAYRDTWGKGRASYLSMLYERLVLLNDLLRPGGSIYIHCDWHIGHAIKMLADEIFGEGAFDSEIIWKSTSAHANNRTYGSIHQTLLFYAKGGRPSTFNTQYVEYDQEYVDQYYRYEDPDGRKFMSGDLVGHAGVNPVYEWRGITRPWRFPSHRLDELDATGKIFWTKNDFPRLKRYLDEAKGMPAQSIWTDKETRYIVSWSSEGVGYPTQKPLGLLNRIVAASSNPGDLVLDAFCGSGTTLVSAEELGRRWIGCDLGRFAIHTTRKRLLGVADCEPFEIMNLGAYERQHWQQATTGSEVGAYLNFVLSLYGAETLEDYAQLHGKKGERLVHVGAVDAPVTVDEIEYVLDELAANDLASVDVLGWEWEMGLHDVVGEVARRRGLDVRCRQIPREVMKAELEDEVRFFELAFLDLQVDRESRSVRVQLRDFMIPSDELIPDAVREKIMQWSDYIDYWSVDFDFRDDTFHNEWQAYRTRDEPELAVESDWHDYDKAGRYAIVVKVIDIFGNDTTKLAEVVVK